MKKTALALSATALALALTGCATAGPVAKTELEKRGFTDATIMQENSTVATVWAGAPGTTCRFLFRVQTSGQGAGDITLIQRSSTGDSKKDMSIPDPNIAMLKNPNNWPQIASCWNADQQPAEG